MSGASTLLSNVAMLRAFRARSSELNAELRLALQWWLEVLEGDMVEVRPWRKQRKRPTHMFSDARGEPPRVAAVIFVYAVSAFCPCCCQFCCLLSGTIKGNTATTSHRESSLIHGRAAVTIRSWA